MARTPLVAGNWKMYKTATEGAALAGELRQRLGSSEGVEVAVCPPFPALPSVGTALRGSGIALGAQDMHWEKEGAFTGAVSAGMLLDLGCRFVILGHSERRQHFGETDAAVQRKVRAALAVRLTPIVRASSGSLGSLSPALRRPLPTYDSSLPATRSTRDSFFILLRFIGFL